MLLSEAQSSAQTNFNGEYSIKAKTGDVLVFSFLVWLSPTKVGSSSTINIKMQSGVNLNEVVVVGYGKTQVKLLQELLNKLKLRFWSVKRYKIKALAGEIAGVRVINSSGQPGADATVKIRGIGSVNARSIICCRWCPFVGT
jgi:hypothetical protein